MSVKGPWMHPGFCFPEQAMGLFLQSWPRHSDNKAS